MVTKPVRFMNPVEPLPHQGTAMRNQDTAIVLVAASAHSARASACFDYGGRLCYSSDRSKEHGIGVPVDPAARAATFESAAFCFVAPFWRPNQGAARLASSRSAGSLVRQPVWAASCDWRRRWQLSQLTPTEAIMADIIEHPRARPDRVIQTRIRGRLPKAVPSLWRARSNKRMAQYEAEQIAEKISAYNEAIERAAHYIRECKLTILNLSAQRAKGARS